MTRVDFYIIESDRRDALRVACRLAEKAYLDDMSVCVRAASPEQATQLDRLLWLFRDGSFVPHCYAETPDEQAGEPVLIACGDLAGIERDVLINLADSAPANPEQHQRIAELVDNNDNAKIRGRERFKHYREQGYSLNTHKL